LSMFQYCKMIRVNRLLKCWYCYKLDFLSHFSLFYSRSQFLVNWINRLLFLGGLLVQFIHAQRGRWISELFVAAEEQLN